MATAIQHTVICEELNAYAHEKRCGACGHHEIRYVEMHDIAQAVQRGERLKLRPLKPHDDCKCFACLMRKGNQRGRLRSATQAPTPIAIDAVRGETPAEVSYRSALLSAQARIEWAAIELRSEIQGTTQAMAWRHRSVIR